MTVHEACCVLVVEDEFYLAKDVLQTLKDGGFQAMGPFQGADEALAALERQQPDCAIIDVNTGEGPDFRIADALQKRRVPFLFFTGYDREVIPKRFADVARLQKPVDSGRLLHAIETTCRPQTP